MLITSDKLQELRACVEAVNFFEEHYKEIEIVELLRDVVKYEEEISKEYNSNVYGWRYWLIASILSRKAAVRFAVYAAEKVLHIYEDEYPEDKRPREAIEAAKAYLENPKADAIAYAARDAAYDAYAAWAAYAVRDAYDADGWVAYVANAAWAARAVACVTAYAARGETANAAYVVGDAAWYASYAPYVAAYAAASATAVKDEILEFGIKLLQEEEE